MASRQFPYRDSHITDVKNQKTYSTSQNTDARKDEHIWKHSQHIDLIEGAWQDGHTWKRTDSASLSLRVLGKTDTL